MWLLFLGINFFIKNVKMDPRIFPVALHRPIGGILENILTPLLHPIKNSIIVQKIWFWSHFVPYYFVNERLNFQVHNMVIECEKCKKVRAILYGLLWRKTRRSNTYARNSRGQTARWKILKKFKSKPKHNF